MAAQPQVFSIQQFTSLGDPLIGGRIYTYLPGTTTHQNAFIDEAGTTPQTYTNDGLGGQYIALNARGEIDNPFYITVPIDIVLKTAAGATIWTRKATSASVSLSGDSGSSLVGFLQSGSGSAGRTVQAHLRDYAMKTLEDKGATGDGTTDDSTAFTNYIADRTTKTYVIGGIDLADNRSLDMLYNKLKAKTASSYMVSLNGYSSVLADAYISDATAATVAVKFGSGGRFNKLVNVDILNAQTGISFAPGSGSNDRAKLSNVQVETYSVDGMYVDANVSEINSVNVYLDSGIEIANDRPKRGTNGYRHEATGSTTAFGGHLHTNMTAINCETGFYLTDAALTTFQNCIADGTAGYGIKIDGATGQIVFANTFVGTSLGISVGGTATNIYFHGLTTLFNGVTPPWGGANFFTSAGPYYDVTLTGTAEVTIDGNQWFGNKRVSCASTATLNVTGGQRREWTTNAAVAAGSTVYLDVDGATATEIDTVFRMPFDGYLFCFYGVFDAAPGAGQTFTYTARINGSDTAFVATATGAATFSTGMVYPTTEIFANKGDAITIKLVTSGTAGAGRHQGNLHILAV